jgi:hypothetical protein
MIQKVTETSSPRALFRMLSFRGSVIMRVAHDSSAERVVLCLDLLNYNQVGYDFACDPETSAGSLSFEGVSVLELDPADALSPLPEGGDAEVLRLDASEERGGLAVVALVLQRADYVTHENVTLVARFHAASVAWRPSEC